MMRIYRHTQVGALVLWPMGTGLLVVLGVLASGALDHPPAARVLTSVAIVLVALLLLFHSLTVDVTDEGVLASFGVGLIRKRFPAGRISGARVVRNHWYYGLGIRLTPHGWLFAVSGLDAVEIDLPDKRRFRIGTDDPRGLIAAIEQSAGLRPTD